MRMNLQKRLITIIGLAGLLLALALSGCAALPMRASETAPAAESPQSAMHGPGMSGMGSGSGMMQRHMATIPAEFQDKSSPEIGSQGLKEGGELYALHCATCHGNGSMGDGPAGAALDPVPSAVAHTSQMMGDAYLYWRIQEGGGPFSSAMPAWNTTLSEEQTWAVITYVRALGRGEVQPASQAGGQPFDPQAEAKQQAAMLATAVEQKVITQAEADLFDKVHGELDALRTPNQGGGPTMMEQLAGRLQELVRQGKVTQPEADAFLALHQKLVEAGLME
jgi:mono/diheme cytochrome c family protein